MSTFTLSQQKREAAALVKLERRILLAKAGYNRKYGMHI